MKRGFLFSAGVYLALGATAFMASCNKNAAVPQVAPAQSVSHAVDASPHSKHAIIVIAIYARFISVNLHCIPFTHNNCLEVYVFGKSAALDAINNDINVHDQHQLALDFEAYSSDLEGLFGTDNVEGVIAGTTTVSLTHSEELNQDWYLFNSPNAEGVYIGVASK